MGILRFVPIHVPSPGDFHRPIKMGSWRSFFDLNHAACLTESFTAAASLPPPGRLAHPALLGTPRDLGAAAAAAASW